MVTQNAAASDQTILSIGRRIYGLSLALLATGIALVVAYIVVGG